MRNRTRVIAAAAAVTAAVTAGSAAAAASTTGATPGPSAQAVSATQKCSSDSDLAAQLGVPTARLDQAARAVKTSLVTASAKPTADQFYAALSHALGISQARVQQVLSAGTACGSRQAGSKQAESTSAERQGEAALTVAVARELHVTTARVSAALQPLFAAGHADPSSPAFAAAARSLGLSSQQLSSALVGAKQALAAGSS
jgi:hypothetical protein